MSVDLEYNEVDNGFMDVRPLDLMTPPSQCTQKDHGVYLNLSRFMLISYSVHLRTVSSQILYENDTFSTTNKAN